MNKAKFPKIATMFHISDIHTVAEALSQQVELLNSDFYGHGVGDMLMFSCYSHLVRKSSPKSEGYEATVLCQK